MYVEREYRYLLLLGRPTIIISTNNSILTCKTLHPPQLETSTPGLEEEGRKKEPRRRRRRKLISKQNSCCAACRTMYNII
jgi:hypothetical protein